MGAVVVVVRFGRPAQAYQGAAQAGRERGTRDEAAQASVRVGGGAVEEVRGERVGLPGRRQLAPARRGEPVAAPGDEAEGHQLALDRRDVRAAPYGVRDDLQAPPARATREDRPFDGVLGEPVVLLDRAYPGADDRDGPRSRSAKSAASRTR